LTGFRAGVGTQFTDFQQDVNKAKKLPFLSRHIWAACATPRHIWYFSLDFSLDFDDRRGIKKDAHVCWNIPESRWLKPVFSANIGTCLKGKAISGPFSWFKSAIAPHDYDSRVSAFGGRKA
jgi:hypothetical protein